MSVHRLVDYRPPVYVIGPVQLHFDIHDHEVFVRCRYTFQRAVTAADDAPFFLDGRALDLQSFRLDGQSVAVERLSLSATGLILLQPPASGALEIVTRLKPAENTSLEGLYQSSSLLCTQCEAHGFSRITYFPDRPDVLTTYEVTLEADLQRYPRLLANGNLIAQEVLANGRHWAKWLDPFPKPCYLFAVVAGELDCVERVHIRPDGRPLKLQVYVDPGLASRAIFALHALQNAVQWDEQVNGLVCDVDQYMVVAVRDFNMGAMENKGLNIFNSRYVLADAESATDQDYDLIEAIIGHEYFHNWTGNRVTCRDWFQLSLKEGLTVFREQAFCAAQGSVGLRRIETVRTLRSHQFPEDAGPLAHPVQPQAYSEVNNFYTATVYEKGAEVVGMLHSLLGHDIFQRGLKRYLRDQDGRAATIDDWLCAHEAESGRDLAGFRRWYVTPGTPQVSVQEHFEAERQCYRLTLTQHSQSAEPLTIPLKLALVTDAGTLCHESLVELTQSEQTIEFEGLTAKPALSINRGFTAPVMVQHRADIAEFVQIVQHESDAYARWEALQQLAWRDLEVLYAGGTSSHWTTALSNLALQPVSDAALLAFWLKPPTAAEIFARWHATNPQRLAQAYRQLERQLAQQIKPYLADWLRRDQAKQPYRYDAAECGRRALWAQWLRLACVAELPGATVLALHAVETADNMTDRLAAFKILNEGNSPERAKASAWFFDRAKSDPLRLDQWFAAEAIRQYDTDAEAWDAISRLLRHDLFDWRNPNRVRSVIGSFCLHQWAAFHADGCRYPQLAEWLRELDAINPQTAARLAQPLSRGGQLADLWREGMLQALLHLKAARLSPDLTEVVQRALSQAVIVT